MSGRKGKGTNPLGYFEPNRQYRRRIARGKGLKGAVAPTLAKQAAALPLKESDHE